MKIPGVILFIVLIFTISDNFAQTHKYGLSFASYDSLKDQRTGINLFPEKSPEFKNDFTLSFDISLRNLISTKMVYGYIFRTVLNDEKNIDLIYSHKGRDKKVFNLINENQPTNISFDYDIDYLHKNWAKCIVHFMLAEDKISFQLNDTMFVQEKVGFDKHSKVKFYFGACCETNYTTTDVPAILIKDIKIEEKSKLKYHWPLDETTGDKAYDIIKHSEAKVNNPVWLKYDYLNWKKVGNIRLQGFAKIIDNKYDDVIYFLGEKKLIKYDLKTTLYDTIQLFGDSLSLVPNNQAIFNNRFIIVYNPNNQLIVKIHPKTGKVEKGISNSITKRNYFHHNNYYDSKENRLYVFNGYGHYAYKNGLFQYSLNDDVWMEIPGKGKKYEPRYLAASGYLNDTLYVLGGYGCATGDQRLNPRYFYDLNTIALDSFSYHKKWDYDQTASDFCFVNSLVIDSLTRNFYSLKFSKQTYNSSLQLIKGSLDDKSFENVGSKIEYRFNDVNSFADIMLNKNLNKLFAFTLFSKEYTKSDIQIYSINYPPLPEEVISADSNTRFFIYMLLVAFAGLTILVVRLTKKKHATVSKQEKKNDLAIPMFELELKKRSNAIYFFGGFQAINKHGDDITKKFSRLLKELFLLVLFKSVGDSTGITSEKLIEHLWFDKSLKSGRNNLSVNVAKLKEILKEFDGCELSHDTGSWRLIIDSKLIFIEYVSVHHILEHKGSDISREMLLYLLQSTNKGSFLVNVDYEWLDVHKGHISDRLVDILIRFAEALDMKEDSALIIEIADCLFNFDVVNEEAMVLKCKTQSLLGKHSISKKTYENFCKEYQLIYGESFSKTFSSIINEAN